MDQGQLRWAILDIFRKEAGPRWSLWRPLCGFGNFGNNIENFRFFWEILKVLRFWKIMCHDFQSRRPIMTLGGVYRTKKYCLSSFVQTVLFKDKYFVSISNMVDNFSMEVEFLPLCDNFRCEGEWGHAGRLAGQGGGGCRAAGVWHNHWHGVREGRKKIILPL